MDWRKAANVAGLQLVALHAMCGAIPLGLFCVQGLSIPAPDAEMSPEEWWSQFLCGLSDLINHDLPHQTTVRPVPDILVHRQAVRVQWHDGCHAVYCILAADGMEEEMSAALQLPQSWVAALPAHYLTDLPIFDEKEVKNGQII